MENLNTLEQPSVIVEEVKVNEPIVEEKDNITSNTDSSTYGKFKDATSLLNAYENLEKEFTRKSQKLAEILKTQENKTTDLDVTSAQNSELYKQSNWQTNVSNFFNEFPDAKNYAGEISKILLADKDLARSKDCLKYAYANALINAQNKLSPAYSLDNPKYFDEVTNNSKVKDKIIKDYLSKIKTNQSNLHFISGEPNNISPTPPIDKPKNLKEASNILKKLLQS